VNKDAWLGAARCALLLCCTGAAQATPDCAALARAPSWAECAADFSLGAAAAATAAFDGPSQLQFDDDVTTVAAMDLTLLAIQPNGSPRQAVEAPSTVAAIPEPHTNLLMVAGLAAIAFMATRRRRP
jgi:PEP-CTERM motif